MSSAAINSGMAEKQHRHSAVSEGCSMFRRELAARPAPDQHATSKRDYAAGGAREQWTCDFCASGAAVEPPSPTLTGAAARPRHTSNPRPPDARPWRGSELKVAVRRASGS